MGSDQLKGVAYYLERGDLSVDIRRRLDGTYIVADPVLRLVEASAPTVDEAVVVGGQMLDDLELIVAAERKVRDIQETWTAYARSTTSTEPAEPSDG